MARYKITLTIDAKHVAAVRNATRLMQEAASKEAKVQLRTEVEKLKRNRSRGDRLEEAIQMVGDAASIVEELKDELQDWLDGIPENMQGGSKADELNDAISQLETLYSELDGVRADVDFPGMF